MNHLKNENLELIAYSNSKIKDSLSVKLKSHFTNWREIESQSNMDVINVIRKDGIHILIDLSGHSRKNRLPIFINKPAPIQVSWAGYPGSTGIPEIDYMIGDRFVTPENESGHFTEKIFRLPSMWVCFSEPRVGISWLVAICLLGYVSFQDDKRGVPIKTRLAAQILASIGMWVSMGGAALPIWQLVLGVCLLIAFTNFVNFMDGINGLASGQLILMPLGAALLYGASGEQSTGIPLVMALVMASEVSFLARTMTQPRPGLDLPGFHSAKWWASSEPTP